MDLRVAIHATAIDGPYVQSLSGGRRMPWQHMNVALLAYEMSTSGQKLGIIRTMWRVTVQAILPDGWMVPEKWTTFFGMTGIANVIDSKLAKHSARLAAMRIMAGRTTNLHVSQFSSKQVR
jgi:hypothetical protein